MSSKYSAGIREGDNVNRFLIENEKALSVLEDKIVGEAMAKLPCLTVGSQRQVRDQLNKLMVKTVFSWFAGGVGCTGAWESDGTFEVAIHCDDESGQPRLSVALCLGEVKIG